MMLLAANRRGLFEESLIGTYSETVRRKPEYTQSILDHADRNQVGACYLGDYAGQELARMVFDSVAAGYPVVMGTSVAVSEKTKYRGKVKTACLSGSWMHATARVAYRQEADGTEYIAHQGSWGAYWERGPEGEPASVVWEDFETFARQCSGRYVDAFVITTVEY